MKTIGLLGGMSWESTALYYRLINQGVKERLGALHSARIAMISVDFQKIEQLQSAGDWRQAGQVLARDAQRVEAAGADFLLICTNTMHCVAPAIQETIRIPILHIADATGERIHGDGIRTVGLLGTEFTMAQDFYKGRLTEKYGLEVIVPDQTDRRFVHDVIFDELCRGMVREESRQGYIKIIDRLHDRGAQAIIEGCTEIVLLVDQTHSRVPLYDTTAIHAEAAVERALA